MEFRQLSTFRVASQLLSFTRASERLHMAQSSVSAQIRGLEEELGVRLFDRVGRRVVLTDAGRRLYDYASRIEGMTDEMRAEVIGKRYSRGNLTIRMPDTLATVYMPLVIEQFDKEYPEVQLSFIHCSDYKLSRELNAGSIDLAFLMTEDVHIQDVNVDFVASLELVLAAAPCHRLASLSDIRPHDLMGQTILYPKTD